MIKVSALVVALGVLGFAQTESQVPDTLPAKATAKLNLSLAEAKPHARHVWRDTPPFNADGTILGYIEISRGDRRKWEFNIAKHERAIDRMIPESIGGYPINYGIVPQTVSYDGDPFDVLVLGPPIEGGRLVRGLPVGLMLMEDDHILDSKVVISPVNERGEAVFRITDDARREVTSFFNRYKSHEPGASTSVPGWGTKETGIALVRQTHAFFLECREKSGDCPIARPK